MTLCRCIIVCCFVIAGCNDQNKEIKTLGKDGAKQEYIVRDKDTLLVSYAENGSTNSIVTISNDRPNGKCVFFHSNGKIAETGLLVNQSKNGVWKYFDENEQLIKVLQYYNDSIQFVLDKDDYVFTEVTIISETDTIKVNLPLKWHTVKKHENKKLLLVSKKSCEGEKFCPNLTLTTEKLQDDLSFEDYLQTNLSMLEQKFSDLKVITEDKFMLNKADAFKLVYIMSFDNLKLGGTTVWFVKNNNVFILTTMASNQMKGDYLKYKGLFDEIINSLVVF